MDIVRFRGGLGNQMFQYAFYQALKQRGREVKANLGFYRRRPQSRSFGLTEVFPNIVLEEVSDEIFDDIDSRWIKIKSDSERLEAFLKDYDNRFFFVEDGRRKWLPEVFETKNCTFVGYWQSEKYFQDIKEILLEDFTFKVTCAGVKKLQEEFLGNKSYVSVHIRRGDYLNYKQMWGNLSENGYYQKAILYMKNRIPNARFVFFSDDIEWVKVNYRYDNAIYIGKEMFDYYEFWYDMFLMSCCAHNIIANSSFSWWGAWLNQNESKTVIAPEMWFFDGKPHKDICPVSWIRL